MVKTTNNLHKLANAIGARNDIIYVVSHEETRVLDTVCSIAKSLKFPLCTWSMASGVKPIHGTITTRSKYFISKKPDDEVILSKGDLPENPLAILDAIQNCSQDAIFVLYDFHTFLKDAGVVRMLKDVVTTLKSSYTPVIIISSVLKIPVEMEKLTTVIDYTLPTPEEISDIVTGIIDYMRDKGKEVLHSQDIKDDIIKACKGLTANEIEDALMASYVEYGRLKPEAILEQKKQIIKKSDILEYYEATDKLQEVGGMDNLKDWIRKRKHAFTPQAREFGIPAPKGLVLLGVPGCGKTLMCKAIANYWGMPLLRFDVGRVMQGIVGSSEENMRKAIAVAEAIQPCVLWIDEIEKGFSGTGSSNFSDAGTLARCFATFLTWLSEKKSDVFVVATANDIKQLPPELLRKGRFDDIFFVDLPSIEERKEIFRIHLQKRNRDPEKFDLDELAQGSEGFSGADIEASIEAALYDVYSEYMGRVDISTFDIINAMKATVPLSKTMEDQINEIREWCRKNRAKMASSKGGI